MGLMPGKMFAGLLMALVLGSCPCLASLASAASASEHACCPQSSDQAQDSDCCLRAPMPSGVTLTAPVSSFTALVNPAPAVSVVSEKAWLDSSSPSPPGQLRAADLSCRAPPSPLA